MPAGFVPALLLAWLLVGQAAWADEPISLRAGPLTMIFEPDNAFLRYIRLGEDEVLRGISAPVRNEAWGTVKPEVEIVVCERMDDQFTLLFETTCHERDIDFRWRGTITGATDGTLEYAFEGQALSDFKRNRIGFCVLHGESAAGQAWLLETTNGEQSRGHFPKLIAPHQPAQSLTAVAHEFAPGRWARVAFEGEVFEMEDQRNWTDASFKTYCTPLALPYPVQVRRGDIVRQKITLKLSGDIPAKAPEVKVPEAVRLTVGDAMASLPGIGVCASAEAEGLSPADAERLRALLLNHLRVDLWPDDDGFSASWKVKSSQAEALGTKLIAAVHLGEDKDKGLERLVAECKGAKPPVAVWLIISADKATVQKAREALKPLFPEALIGTGEDTNFTELNRNRPDPVGLDVVSYGMNPQVHAFDNLSMVETLPIQGQTVLTARDFLKDMPLIVGPITLSVQQPRGSQPQGGAMPLDADPRQPSPFAAAWTLGSIKYLAEAGADRLTYFETVGPKGIMAGTDLSVPQERFPARPGDVYPLYYLLKTVNQFAGGQVYRTESSRPSEVVGLTIGLGRHRRLVVANLTAKPQAVEVAGLGEQGMFGLLPDDQAELVDLGKPFSLPPYGIAMIDQASD